jgi:hypothetical protein
MHVVAMLVMDATSWCFLGSSVYKGVVKDQKPDWL